MTYRWRMLVALLLTLLSVGSTLTVLSLAIAEDLPDDLGAAPATLSWAVTAAVLAQAVCASLFGKVGDVHGPRRVFVAASAVLAVSTPLSALAWDAPSLIAFRVLSGAAAGAAVASAGSMILREFTGPDRARALGYFQSAMTLAPAVGLLVGGPVIEAIGWRWMFGVFALLAWLGLAAAVFVLRPTPPIATETRIDVTGALLIGLTVATVLIGIDLGGRRSFTDALPLLVLGIGLGLAAVFVLVERRQEEPLIRLDYFRRRNYILPTLVVAAGNYAYMGALVVAPLLFQRLLGWGIAATSYVLFMRPFTFSLTSSFGGRMHRLLGDRGSGVVGMAILMVAMAMQGFGAYTTNLPLIIVGLIASGAALGLSLPGLSTTIGNATDPADYGVATGMRATITQIGVTAGLQTMVVALGGEFTEAAFLRSFMVAFGVAAVGFVLALSIAEHTRPGARSLHGDGVHR